ncbi:MAG: prepilin-type N-terminal cleavage/methylation domain-containing protein [Akkermansia sp.]|nr:prepilin-type N-terminal cleavage/methylation domain-containing protein [Akkermansia sp.]
MKTFCNKRAGGFTLVELMVVMTIIGVMMTLAASVLRDSGKGRGLESGVDMLESMVREARATAQGNDCYTRLIIAKDEKNMSQDSRHLRYMTVQMKRKNENSRGTYDGTDVAGEGVWVSTSSGVTLPPGVYFSPTYSTTVKWMDNAGGDMLGTEVTRLSGKGQTAVYYIEFDEKGRYVTPQSDPLNTTPAQRLVVISGRRGTGNRAKDGVIPSDFDSQRRPAAAAGIVIWPRGDISQLRTARQVYDEN